MPDVALAHFAISSQAQSRRYRPSVRRLLQATTLFATAFLSLCCDAPESTAGKIRSAPFEPGAEPRYQLVIAPPSQTIESTIDMDMLAEVKIGFRKQTIPMKMRLVTLLAPSTESADLAKGRFKSIKGEMNDIVFSSAEVHSPSDTKPESIDDALINSANPSRPGIQHSADLLNSQLRTFIKNFHVEFDYSGGFDNATVRSQKPQVQYTAPETPNLPGELTRNLETSEDALELFLGVPALLPSEKVGRGASWTAMRSPGDIPIGEVPFRMTLERIEESNGEKIAVIDLRAAMRTEKMIKIETENGPVKTDDLELDVTGTWKINITRKREQSLEQHVELNYSTKIQGKKLKSSIKIDFKTQRAYPE